MKIYELIYQQLESEILLGNYPPETFLPSESQLAKHFEASRDTIRKALQQLTNHGYIKKVQGKGSLVLRREQLRFPVSGLTSYKELENAYGYDSSTQVESLTKLIVKKELAEKTGIPQADISRLENGTRNPSLKLLKRLADGLNMDLGIVFVPKRIRK